MNKLITNLNTEIEKEQELIHLECLKALEKLQEFKRKHNITYK